MTQLKPVLYLVACGARPAGESARVVEHARGVGFTTCVVTTPMARRFIGNPDELEKASGYPLRTDYKQPDEPDVHPLPDAFLVAPLTFNTLNAWAAGFSPTLALGLLNETLGMGVPVTAVPWVNAQLAAHPAAAPSMERLRTAGVQFTSGFAHRSSRVPGPDGRTASPVYPWDEIEEAIASMRERCRQP